MKLNQLILGILFVWASATTVLAQSRYCYPNSQITFKGGETSLVVQDTALGASMKVRVTVSPLVTRFGYILTDETNQILKIGLSNFIEIADLQVGRYRIWAFSHIGDIIATPGDNAATAPLASFCYELTTNYVSLEIQGQETLFTLQILHHNDAESALLNAGENFPNIGGVHRFGAILNGIRNEAVTNGYESMLFSAGDNFLAGPILTAGIRRGNLPLYDVEAQSRFNYDAIGIGNHEFDFGPDILAKYIRDFGSDNAPIFLSANLDFSLEPILLTQVDQGRIASSTIIQKGAEQIGVIGVTTPNLSFISSPRRTIVLSNLAEIISNEVNILESQGINKIILISHLQGINNDLELAQSLEGIDVVIAGGGDEFLSNQPEIDAIPGLIEAEDVRGAYPLTVQDAAGKTVYVVATPGRYIYLGNLTVSFSESGEIVDIKAESGPVKIETETPDPELEELVVEPVTNFVQTLRDNVIGRTQIELNGKREDVRTQETNAGNLIADAILFQANLLASNFGIQPADIAIQNGGGIRNSVVIPPLGDITEFNTFNMLPFPNFVSIVEDIDPAQLKQIMERAVSGVESVEGQFAQIAGFRLRYDPSAQPQLVDEAGNIITAGERVVSIVLNNGQSIVENGQISTGAPNVRIATIDFLARGGDAYPFGEATFTNLGATYQQALVFYIVGVLGGGVPGFLYPEGGEGRIDTTVAQTEIQMGTLPDWENSQNWSTVVTPNPFIDKINLNLEIEDAATTTIQLLDVRGVVLRDFFNGFLYKGPLKETYDLSDLDLGAGIYFISIKNGSSHKIISVVHH